VIDMCSRSYDASGINCSENDISLGKTSESPFSY
jgi:hypothetical protein